MTKTVVVVAGVAEGGVLRSQQAEDEVEVQVEVGRRCYAEQSLQTEPRSWDARDN
jgi:hypothetical protein